MTDTIPPTAAPTLRLLLESCSSWRAFCTEPMPHRFAIWHEITVTAAA
ncbi:MAG: hypothetical protein ACRDTD_23130 [Pseudonocardiaceae bacterium]